MRHDVAPLRKEHLFVCTSENKGPAFGVRMKPSLKRYVEQWPGKNFSDKLEAIISFYQEVNYTIKCNTLGEQKEVHTEPW